MHEKIKKLTISKQRKRAIFLFLIKKKATTSPKAFEIWCDDMVAERSHSYRRRSIEFEESGEVGIRFLREMKGVKTPLKKLRKRDS